MHRRPGLWLSLAVCLTVSSVWAEGGPDGAEDVIRGESSAAASETESEGGFAHHVREALAINRARREIYAELSGGVSEAASGELIRGERVTLPFAWWYDRRARGFNERGIGIVHDDFVSMDAIRPPETPPRYRRVVNKAEKKRIKALLREFRGELKALLKDHDFAGAAERTRVALGAVQSLERVHAAHWAMTVHLLEQIGLSAERAVGYVATDPEVADLAQRFICFQALGLQGAVSVDHKAQRAHVLGVGVIVNDLPPIPFHAHD